MPLPANGTNWPPKELAVVSPAINAWAAWYSGDPEELGTVYGQTGSSMRPRVRSSQYAGGVLGTVARWFWGQPPTEGQQRAKLHVPIAADIATASSDLLFSEQPRIVTSDDAQAEGAASPLRDRLDVILDGIGWESLLPEAGEIAAAMTGVYLRVVWDETLADHPLVTTVQPDAAIPEFALGRLRAVTFWQVIHRDGGAVWRHLERHEPGRIEHGLFVGTSSNLGTRVPLAEHPATAGITVNADSVIETGAKGLTAEFIPNVRPARRASWRHDPIGAHLGRSDFDGIEPGMDAIDEVFTSWMRDIRIGKGRIIVDQAALDSNGRGQGATFDLDREVLMALNVMGADDKAPVTPQQFAIRAADHQATISALLERVISGAGYSLQTFGLDDDGGAQTATEVAAKERKSMTTREKKSRYWTPALRRLLTTLLEVDKAKFKGAGPMETITVEFPPSVQPTPLELAQTATALKAAQAASAETRVKMVHPDWNDTQVQAEVEKILAEESLSVPDFGIPSGPPGNDDPPVDDPAE